jgi:3-dehydroquinate dehydratase
MRILVLHGPSDPPQTGDRLEAAARELGVELAIRRADDEQALAAAIEIDGNRVQGVLISPGLSRRPHDALNAMRVPVVEVPRSYAVALRSMVEMLRSPDA